MAGLPKELFVVVAESNGIENTPIAFETECFDIESAIEFKRKIGSRYGRKAIYKATLISTDLAEKEKYGDVK